MVTTQKIWTIIVLIWITACLLLLKCEQEPAPVVTKIEYVKVTDTVTKTIIEKVPKVVYVKKTNDSIIYVNDTTAIKANQYTTKLLSNNASADLKITTTGELLDVQGVINYTQTNTTIEKPKSGLFLYGETSVNPVLERLEVGLDYQIKNAVIIGTSASYNNVSKSVYFNIKMGFRI